ncbi:MAG: aquaporin [Alphaproteobacteria bacterium]
MHSTSLTRRLGAEFLGTAFLLATIAGSGIMGETLAAGQAGAALLPHSLAIGAILFVMITLLGPVSGAHFNPAVSLAFVLRGDIGRREASFYVTTQIIAAIIGVWIAHLMFDISILQASAKARTGIGQWSAELVATFGLVFTILAGLKARPQAVPALVALYIMAALWFTASTGFANPAVTVARMLTDTFSGIAPADAPGFIAAQLAGAALAVPAARLLWPGEA